MLALFKESRLLLCYRGREARRRQSSLTFNGDQKDISAYEHVSAIAEQMSLSSQQSHLPPQCFQLKLPGTASLQQLW